MNQTEKHEVRDQSVITQDPSVRAALGCIIVALAAAAFAVGGFGEDPTTLAKGLSFVFVILAIHCMTTPRP